MLTKPIASAIYRKLCSAPPAWFKTRNAKRLIAKSVEFVRTKEGDEEAEILSNLLVVAEVFDVT